VHAVGQVSGAASPTWQFCGRSFEAGELEIIRQIVASDPQQSRTALSRAVCAALNWSKPDGRPKEVSCRVALLRMASQGLFS